MLAYMLDVAPALALVISLAALLIGLHNLRAQLRASLLVSWASHEGRQRYLVVANMGPGSATILTVQLQNDPQARPEDFRYAADRDVFPFQLGSQGSFLFQLDKDGQQHPTNVLVRWRDGAHWLTQSRRLPVSSPLR